MIFTVNDQARIFLWTIAGGMAIAFVYDIFRIFRKTVKTGRLLTYAQDLLYWLIVAVVMFLTIYYSNDGELRAYLFLGAFLGVVFYALVFSKIIMNSSLFVVRTAVKIVKAILYTITYPFKFISRILIVLIRKLNRMADRIFRKAKTGGMARASRLIFLKKSLSHIRKKI